MQTNREQRIHGKGIRDISRITTIVRSVRNLRWNPVWQDFYARAIFTREPVLLMPTDCSICSRMRNLHETWIRHLGTQRKESKIFASTSCLLQMFTVLFFIYFFYILRNPTHQTQQTHSLKRKLTSLWRVPMKMKIYQLL